MRILHTVPHVCKEASGPSYSVSRLCDELGGTGHDVSLFTLDAQRRTDARQYRHEVFAGTPVAARLGIYRERGPARIPGSPCRGQGSCR